MRCSVFINFINNLDINHELINIFKEIIKNYKDNTNKSISPIRLVQYYSRVNKRYRIGKQEDADEVLTYLIGNIDDIIKTEIKENRINDYIIKNDVKLSNMIDFLFSIGIKSYIKCLVCNNISHNKSNEYKISLGITDNNLDDLLDNFSKPEELNDENEYFCEKCKKKVKAIKIDKIIKTPKYLHIQLKRFENNLSKINKDVKIPVNININNVKYQLRGNIQHIGSSFGGHYIYNYNKNKSNNFEDWICLNDSSISSKNITNDINGGYVFLYVK
jgi:ubiquitin carboxyl-terminal hydrolase 36/42